MCANTHTQHDSFIFISSSLTCSLLAAHESAELIMSMWVSHWIPLGTYLNNKLGLLPFNFICHMTFGLNRPTSSFYMIKHTSEDAHHQPHN